MKKLAPLALALALSTSGCYGQYAAFHALHKWNGTVTADRIGNSAIHALLWIVPVYELFIVADILIFNTIETLTGDNVLQ